MTDRATENVEPLPTLYTPEEVANRLGRSGWWVREQCRRDRFPHTRAAGAIRFTREHFDEILQTLERRPEPPRQRLAGGSRPNRQKSAKGPDVQLRARPPRRARPTDAPDDIGRTA